MHYEREEVYAKQVILSVEKDILIVRYKYLSVNSGHGIMADMIETDFLNQAIGKLKELPGVLDAGSKEFAISFLPRGLNAEITLRISSRAKPYVLHSVFKGSLDRSIIDRFIQEIKGSKLEEIMLVVPYVNPSLADYMNSQGLNFIDLAGNCRLAIGKSFYVFIKGKKLPGGSPYIPKARIAGYLVIFTFLADPSLLNEPVRFVAEKAGIGKSVVASRITSLAKDGFIGRTTKGWRIIRYDDLLERWLIGYNEIIRRRIFNGSYKTRISDPEEREAKVEESLKSYPDNWAWGETSAAWRMVKYYRGESTTLHLASIPPSLILKMEALPSAEGNLVFMRPLGPLSMQGTLEHVVHPLLVYTQLITSNDPRAMETAREIAHFLEKGSRNGV
jgi:hypothetical protein